MSGTCPDPDVSVVIPCLDVVGVIGDQLRALGDQTYSGRFEVLLADNGSSDGLVDHVEAWGKKHGLDMRWVDASATRGVSYARNAGLRAARAPLVAVCDADDVVTPGWLDALVQASAQAPLVAGAVEVESLNNARSVAWRPGPRGDGPPTKFRFLPYAMGCNIAVRRDVAVAQGGWREDYVAGGDDVEFSWRLQLAGNHLVFAPDALVKYRYRSDLKGMLKQIRGYTRCEAKLLRDFCIAGAARARPAQSRRDMGWLWRNIRMLAGDEVERGSWLCRFAALQGRIVGSLRYGRLV